MLLGISCASVLENTGLPTLFTFVKKIRGLYVTKQVELFAILLIKPAKFNIIK